MFSEVMSLGTVVTMGMLPHMRTILNHMNARSTSAWARIVLISDSARLLSPTEATPWMNFVHFAACSI